MMRSSAFLITALCVLAVSLLSPLEASAQTRWLRQWPTAEQIKADVRADAGDLDEVRIEARQAARLSQMRHGLEELTPDEYLRTQRYTIRTGTNGNRRETREETVYPPDIQRRIKEYNSAYYDINNQYTPYSDCPFFGRCKNSLFHNEVDAFLGSRTSWEDAASRYFGGPGSRLRASFSALYDTREAPDSPPLPESNAGFQKALKDSSYVLLGLGILSAIIFVCWVVGRSLSKAASNKKAYIDGQWKRSIEAFLAQFGSNPDEREQAIQEAFDNRSKTLEFRINFISPTRNSAYLNATLARSIASMKPKEREVLRAISLVTNRGLQTYYAESWRIISSIIYGDRSGNVSNYQYNLTPLTDNTTLEGTIKSVNDALEWIIRDNVEAGINRGLAQLTVLLETRPDNPLVRSLVARVLGDGGDLASDAILHPLPNLTQTTEALIIGEDEKDASRLMTFDGQGSLITVAPPGSGKTQCHVIPNLLTWPGPAVVLDIKGEIYAATSGWRRANVGPVYRFDPLNPAKSHAYNPLLAVSDDPDQLWEDSRFLADMLIVPGGKSKDPFWESRARDVLTAAIAATVRDNPSEERGMGKVLDILHGVGWSNFLMALKVAADVPTMVRAGNSLGEMDSKMRDSVLQTALASLSAWEGARIARATSKSDWSPADLRVGGNPTIYICIAPNQIDSYVSMLRVIIAQHIRALTSQLPDREGHPILFVLDELPRLRHMPPVEEALEIGRQYGIKLWMFTQSLGQLETAYENAEGMVGSCAVRMFMNPSLHDETAQKLSDDMGYRESVIDGTRVKRVEANVLAGPEFKDMVIVMASGAEPARVRKHYAYRDAELARRMAMSPAAA